MRMTFLSLNEANFSKKKILRLEAIDKSWIEKQTVIDSSYSETRNSKNIHFSKNLFIAEKK